MKTMTPDLQTLYDTFTRFQQASLRAMREQPPHDYEYYRGKAIAFEAAASHVLEIIERKVSK